MIAVNGAPGQRLIGRECNVADTAALNDVAKWLCPALSAPCAALPAAFMNGTMWSLNYFQQVNKN